MRTRRSPRNQEILFKALFPPPEKATPIERSPRCFDCCHYPKGGRSRGRCALSGESVRGEAENRHCWTDRQEGR